jgi:tetratricopeptide (TPR) repeat protein
MFSLASAHGRASEHVTAERYYAESYGLLSQFTDSDSRQLALGCALSLAESRLLLNQPLPPIIEFLENLRVAFSDDSQQALIKRVLGKCLRYRGQISEALDTLREAKNMFKQTGDLAEVAEVLRDISCVYYESSQFEESLASILEAREAVKSSGISPITAKSAYINIQYGRCLMSLLRSMEALPIFEECLLIFEPMGDLSTAAECLKQMGLVHASQANYHVAFAAFESAIAKHKAEYGAAARTNEIMELERFTEIFGALSAE